MHSLHSFPEVRPLVQPWQLRCPLSRRCLWLMSQQGRSMRRQRSISCVSWTTSAAMAVGRSSLHIVMLWRLARTGSYVFSMGGLSMPELLVYIQNGARTYTRGDSTIVALASATCAIM